MLRDLKFKVARVGRSHFVPQKIWLCAEDHKLIHMFMYIYIEISPLVSQAMQATEYR